MGGILNLVAEVIFVPIIVLAIIGWVVFQRKRKNDRKQKDLELQQEQFGKPWDLNKSSRAMEPVFHGTSEQQLSNVRPWDQGQEYLRAPQQVVYGSHSQQYVPV